MSTPADAPTEPAGAAWFGEQPIALGARMARYELVALVGVGGMGVVFAARDPELDRDVAVKVLRNKGPGSQGEARLRREGQTMARLTHPNVIRVYDVGVAHGHVFVAMEYVKGGTVASWLEAAPRTPAEIIAVFAQAGRGLAAAHDAGLVHRDFKPSNVLVGDDGRVLVTDFGLARAAATIDPDAPPSARPPALAEVTQTGQFVGTPAYMAPEQYASAAVDARADQFSFCVSLWRALFGTAPYDGTTVEELLTASGRGELVEPSPSATAKVSARLRTALARGLRPDPAQRFGSMRDLLMVLEPRASRGRLIAAVGIGGAVAAGAVVWAIAGSRSAPDPCPAPDAQIARVWTKAREAGLRSHLVTVDPATGAQRATAAASVLDHVVPDWRAMHLAACRATRVDGKQSDTLLDARMRCLDDWLAQAAAVVGRLETAPDASAAEAAIKGVGSLPVLSRCADPVAVQAAAQLPTAPAGHAEAITILAEVRAIDGERVAGNLDGLDRRADAVVARARALDNPAAMVRALGIRWRIAVAHGDAGAAIGFLRELTEVAARGHDDYEATIAWTMMGRLTAFTGHPDQGKVMMAAARAALARAGEPGILAVEVVTTEADVLNAAGESEAALAQLEHGRVMLHELGADLPGSPSADLLGKLLMGEGEIRYYADQLDAAVAATRESIAVFDRIYGPDTVESSAGYADLAQVLRDQEKYADAEHAARESIRIRELRTGDSPALAIALMTLSDIIDEQADRLPEAVQLAERAQRIAEARTAPDDMQRQMIRLGVANLYDTAGRTAEALAIYDDVIGQFERAGIVNINMPTFYLLYADMLRRLGRHEDAIARYHKAAQAGTELQGDTSEAIGTALRGEAECLHAMKRDREALVLLEKSLGKPAAAFAAEDVELGNGLLGILLVDAGRDQARGLALARTALARLRELDSTDARVERLAAWLARHEQ